MVQLTKEMLSQKKEQNISKRAIPSKGQHQLFETLDRDGKLIEITSGPKLIHTSKNDVRSMRRRRNPQSPIL